MASRGCCVVIRRENWCLIGVCHGFRTCEQEGMVISPADSKQLTSAEETREISTTFYYLRPYGAPAELTAANNLMQGGI